MDKVFYLCDGKIENCKKTRCYKNKTDCRNQCRYTSDINHAINFKNQFKAGDFYEMPSTNDVMDGSICHFKKVKKPQEDCYVILLKICLVLFIVISVAMVVLAVIANAVIANALA